MDEVGCKLLICVENKKFRGLVSIGDIQRAIIKNRSLEEPVFEILREKNLVAQPDDSIDYIKELMLQYRMEFLPVINSDNDIQKVYFWEDLFDSLSPSPLKKFNVPVVVMAGGIGSRLRPLTNVLPKPLIPIGDKSMIEEIFDRFNQYGCDLFYVSINYKAELIKYYFNNLNFPYQIKFFKEKLPLGTAGSLYLIKKQIKSTFFVTNCDILIDQDYSQILDFHRKNKCDITVVAALKHYALPYGIIETGINGVLKEIKEKPEITMKINSGMYVLEPHVLKVIPNNKFLNITDLVEIICKANGKVSVFPVSEKSWKDFGLLEDYLSLIKGK